MSDSSRSRVRQNAGRLHPRSGERGYTDEATPQECFGSGCGSGLWSVVARRRFGWTRKKIQSGVEPPHSKIGSRAKIFLRSCYAWESGVRVLAGKQGCCSWPAEWYHAYGHHWENAMITMLGSPRLSCDGLTRRETLRVGALSLLGGFFNLPSLLALEQVSRAKARRGKAKSVLLLYLQGGPATQDMFDMKPDAPDGIRSEFKAIATSAPGISV